MRIVYFATEVMSAFIVLILIYANTFEYKKQTKARKLFTRLLILVEIIAVSDAITWIDLGWKEHSALFRFFIALTYVVPVLIMGTFAGYLREYISEKTEISAKPFIALRHGAIAVGIVSIFLCFSGKLFSTQDGFFYAGPFEIWYYIVYAIAVLSFAGVIIANKNKLGLHDMLVSLSFCAVPLFSMLLSISAADVNLVIQFISIDMLVIYVMLQTDSENMLVDQTNIDELTGLYNRRAYEDDRLQYPNVPVEPDFVYASFDIDGLKLTNDNLGHTAGDELICGAAECLKRTFGNYGKVYRTGGDEFVSMFFADEEHLKFLLKDFEVITSKWSGKLVDSIDISMGYATKKEFQTQTVDEMAIVSDKRMYADKHCHYAKKGVDRKGVLAAHAALCNIYTKILKINLTQDTYSIIDMDVSEQTHEMGFADTISEWFSGFGNTGHIHPDDMDSYMQITDLDFLKKYFGEGKSSITVLYRRKNGDAFKQAAMEMIPADDYSDENQTLFLYVKPIDM